MRITLRLFAVLRDAAGEADGQQVELADGSRVADLLSMLPMRWPALAAHLPRVMPAVNREYSSRDRVLADGDELALIPPVSGG